MNQRFLKYISFFTVCLLTCLSLTRAQELKKEIYVTSPFRPEVTEADKLSTMPSASDTFSVISSINYTVIPSGLKPEFTLRPIKPAKMVGTPLDQLYNSQLKLGIGNYFTPLAEYSIQNLRSKEYAVGAYFAHKSSHRKQDMGLEEKVPAGYGKNNLMAYGTKFYKNVDLYAELGGGNYKIRHYGINHFILSDSFVVDREEIRQSYYNVYAKAGLFSTNPDSSKLAYNLDLTGKYFWDRFDWKEPSLNVSGSLSKLTKGIQYGIEAMYNLYFLRNPLDSFDQSKLTIHPFFRKIKGEWQVEIGGTATAIWHGDEFSTVKFHPVAKLQIKVIDKAMYGFIGISGYVEQNPYQEMVEKNPFVIPGLYDSVTNHAYNIYAGIEGFFSRKASYKLMMAFKSVEDMIFFNNYPFSPFQNRFYVVNDNVSIINYKAEVAWQPLQFLSFYLKAEYNNYRLSSLNRPWHWPAGKVLFTTRYNFKKKVYAELEFLTLGKRYAIDLNPLFAPGYTTEIILKPVYDLNLKLEYRYSDMLSIFLDMYNMANQKYFLWNRYPGTTFYYIGGLYL